MPDYKFDKRRQEFLDQEMWDGVCKNHNALPTEGVPDLTIVLELPTAKLYYFDADTSSWELVGGEA